VRRVAESHERNARHGQVGSSLAVSLDGDYFEQVATRGDDAARDAPDSAFTPTTIVSFRPLTPSQTGSYPLCRGCDLGGGDALRLVLQSVDDRVEILAVDDLRRALSFPDIAHWKRRHDACGRKQSPKLAGIRRDYPGHENAKTRTGKDSRVLDGSGRDPDSRVRFPLALEAALSVR
jgi:hypothetical protein